MRDIINYNEITFGAWLMLWFERYKKPRLKPNSLRNIEQIIRLHTPDWLKDIPLKSLSVIDIDSALSVIPTSRTYVYTRQVWGSALRKAQALSLIDKNPVELTDKVSYRKKRAEPLTIAEQKEFIEKLEGQRCKWLMLFYLHTGVRRCEALTLLWTDIDEESGLIRIRGTKTENSYRYIPLTAPIKDILAGQRKQEKWDKRVFPYKEQWASKQFKKLCPNHHLHELRHTYITRCAECGVDMVVCQQFVGHSTADMTLNVYTHVVNEYKRKEVAKFSIFPKF